MGADSDTLHSLAMQGDGHCRRGCGYGSGHGWQSGPPQWYQCGALGHIANHYHETLEDAQWMLQDAQEKGCFKCSTQFVINGVEDCDKAHETALQFIQDHRSVQCCHQNIP